MATRAFARTVRDPIAFQGAAMKDWEGIPEWIQGRPADLTESQMAVEAHGEVVLFININGSRAQRLDGEFDQ
jgi:hypothetical protein